MDDNKWEQSKMTIYGKRQSRLEWLMDLKAFNYLVGPKPKNNPNNLDERRLYYFIQRNKSHEAQIDFESREQLRICAMCPHFICMTDSKWWVCQLNTNKLLHHVTGKISGSKEVPFDCPSIMEHQAMLDKTVENVE
jgi:hypothetical protein